MKQLKNYHILDREFNKYTSERQALYYDLAKKEGININDRDAIKMFILDIGGKIDNILNNYKITREKGQEKIDYLGLVIELRKKEGVFKKITLTQLQKICSVKKNEKAYEILGINPDDLLKLPTNKIVYNLEIQNRGVTRIEDLETSQTDEEYGFAAELLANSIDASTKVSSGKFGEGFLQSFDKINIPGSRIVVKTKAENCQGYDVFLEKINGENMFSSSVSTRIINGTSVKLEKKLSVNEQVEIRKLLKRKVKTNTRASILLNGRLLNDLTNYKYINGEKLNTHGLPTVEINIDDYGIEFIDKGVGMSADTIVNKLLKPNATGKVRKRLTDNEVKENSPKETKFFYKEKTISGINKNEKTEISLNIAGFSIENFEVSTFGNIGEFTFEFPGSSPLKDSRNEIDLSREVAISLGISLDKIHTKAERVDEKLSLLEIISSIYEKLKNRPSNIVDEEFILTTVMKNKFHIIKEEIERSGISVLPANKQLIQTIGYPKNVFYISEEFVDFDINKLPNKKEIIAVQQENVKGSFSGEKYRFFEISFIDNAEYDYLVYENCVFVNNKLFENKATGEKDEIIKILNVSVNLNTSYETEANRNNYGRILTTGESIITNRDNKGDNPYSDNMTDLSMLSDKGMKEYSDIKQDIDDFIEQNKQTIKLHGNFNREDIYHNIISIVDHIDKKTTQLLDIKLKILIDFSIPFPLCYTGPYPSLIKTFNIIESFISRKSKLIVKPFLHFIKNYYCYRNRAPVFIMDLPIYIETLVKIMDADPKIAIEFIERFDKYYNGNYGYGLIHDYVKYEEVNAQLDNIGKSKQNYVDTEDYPYTKNSFLNPKYKEIKNDYFEYVNCYLNYGDKNIEPIKYLEELNKKYGIYISGDTSDFQNFKYIYRLLDELKLSDNEIIELDGLVKTYMLTSKPIDKIDYEYIIDTYSNILKKIDFNIRNPIRAERISSLYHYFDKEKSIISQLKNQEKQYDADKIDIFTELSKRYPQDLITFVQFLKSGGEFLEVKESKVQLSEFDIETNKNLNIKMSDLIGLSFSFKNDIENSNGIEDIIKLNNRQIIANVDNSDNTDIIAGVSLAQDEVGMLFNREGTQNSIDAIKRYNKTHEIKIDEKIYWEYYSVNNNFTSSIRDAVGMDLKTLIIKLFTPYNSGKQNGDGVGQFGKGFFTFAPSSKEIKIKTSLGDGKTIYVTLSPIIIDGIISDFEMVFEQKDEDYKGTIIERTDDASGINGNLRAMIGTNLLKKYVGNVGRMEIYYNNTLINKPEDITLINSSHDILGIDKNGDILNLGKIELIKNKDNISRFTKDDLFISEIKDDLLSNLPDFMIKTFNDANLSINIPSKIPLVGSRNSLKNRKYYVDLMKPYFYKQVIDYILKSYIDSDKKIPMLPEDYFSNENIDFRHTRKIINLSENYNTNYSASFTDEDFDLLKDNEKMAEFLVLVKFEYNGKDTSLSEIKKELHKKHRISLTEGGENFYKIIGNARNIMQNELNTVIKYNLSYNEINETSSIKEKDILKFEEFLKKDNKIQFLINKYIGGNFEFSYSIKNPLAIADSYSKGKYGMSFNIMNPSFKNYVYNYNESVVYEKLIDTITHEMTHNLEGDKWGTHENDEEHNKSFIKIQRKLLRDIVRMT